MGADIHMVLEKKHDSKWIGMHNFGYDITRALERDDARYIGFLARDRNYERFAALAGVRGDGPNPKGVPPDASELAKMEVEIDGDDGHSHTWYGLREASEIFDRTSGETQVSAQVAAKLLGERPPIPPCTKYFGVDESDVDEYRVIIWFDN